MCRKIMHEKHVENVYKCNVATLRISNLFQFQFTLGFRMPWGALNGPSSENFWKGPTNWRPLGETGLATKPLVKEFFH